MPCHKDTSRPQYILLTPLTAPVRAVNAPATRTLLDHNIYYSQSHHLLPHQSSECPCHKDTSRPQYILLTPLTAPVRAVNAPATGRSLHQYIRLTLLNVSKEMERIYSRPCLPSSPPPPAPAPSPGSRRGTRDFPLGRAISAVIRLIVYCLL